MAVTNEDGTKVYQTQDRRIAVKEQLISSMFNAIDGMQRIIETSTDPFSDPRLDYMTSYLMTFTLDKKKSKEMRKDRSDRIREEASIEPDATKRNHIIGEINLDSVAECLEIFDNYMGFKKKQVILEVKDGESVKYANELNDTYIDMMMACRGDLIDTSGIRGEDEPDSTKEGEETEKEENGEGED